MIIEAWPFLIGRNKTLGYRPIVAPQFLSEKGLSLLLAESAGGDESHPGSAIYREIRGTEVGDFCLIFRVIRPKARDYDLGDDELLLDRGSRPITLIEGIVVKGRLSQIPNAAISYENLLIAHKFVTTSYREFWHSDSDFVERTSYPFNLIQARTFTERVRLREEQPLMLSPRPRSRTEMRGREWMLLGIVSVLILASAGLYFAYHNYQTTQNNIEATATAFANETATAFANETATAFANETATAFANETATAIAANPTIVSVNQIMPAQIQTITIIGSGFGVGTTQIYNNATSSYLKIQDATGNWEAGYQTINNDHVDHVGVTVSTWTANQIIITSFNGQYGTNKWKFKSGDKVDVSVWNPQTNYGPGFFQTTVT